MLYSAQKFRNILPLTILIFLTIFGSSTTLADSPKECSLGVVPQFEQRRLHSIWQPIADLLTQKTGCQFTYYGNKDIKEFEQDFQAGKFDFAYMNPYHSIMANDAQGYFPILRSSSRKLKGILVVHKDSKINDVTELDGQTLAFPSPNALGASLLMRAELAKKHNLKIHPLYVKTHSSVYLHVGKKLVAAGGGVARTLDGQEDFIKDSLKVIYETMPVNSHPVVAHPRVEQAFMNKVQQALLEIAQDHPNLFADIPMKAPVKSSLSEYEDLRKLGLQEFLGGTDADKF